ncbi:MAG: tetratricopeptide repeat protein [Lysobacter sp.]
MREPQSPHPDADRRSERGPPPRIEPSSEHCDELRFAEHGAGRIGRGSAAGAARAGKRPWLGWTGIAIALLALLLVLRQPLSDWLWPQTRAQQLRADAAQALAQGRLTAADGHGARELYEAALALDPDRTDARAGLARVGEVALAQARRALAERRYADAHRSVALARELAVPTTRVDAVAAALRESEAADAGIERLLQQAAAARAAGSLDGDDSSALRLYQRVLALQPSHTQALEGREDTLADLLQQARQALLRGELAQAAAIVHRARDADPGHADLPGVFSDLSEASEQRHRRADADLRRDRLAAALDGYRTVLAVDPADAEAGRGLARLASAYATRSERLAADFRFDEAEAALREAQAIGATVPAIAQARQHLARARQSQSRYGSKLPTAERQRRLRQWLRQAAAAEARGDLLTPPGDSAFDKLRAARAIAPQDPRVLKASARLLPAAKACFEKELRGNRLGRAGECLDARRVLEGESAAVGESRRRLAQRWIAVGNERLGAGEMQAAQAALAAARRLDPAATGLDEFSERLRAAAAAD